MRFFYDRGYDNGRGLPIKRIHGFLLDRATRIKRALVERHGVPADAFDAPERLTEADLSRVHTPDHLALLEDKRRVAEAIEVPLLRWLPGGLVRRAAVAPQICASGGTLAALRAAVEGAWTANLSGGYHHARPDLAHGFCLVADVAVAVARLRSEELRPKVLIVDLDLHQGDGNAVCFAGDEDVFTLSVHEEGLFPQPNVKSDLDVLVPAGSDDEPYLKLVREALEQAAARFAPDVVVYVAGTDPYVDDPLGSLRVSAAGMLERDELVGGLAQRLGAGLVMLPAGGYTDASPGLAAAGMAALARLEQRSR